MDDHDAAMPDILGRLARWERGVKLGDSQQVRLICHQPERAKLAYLHVLYPALDDGDLHLMSNLINKPLPSKLEMFYRTTNGIRLFESSVCIAGLVTALSRSLEERQPISIKNGNLGFVSLHPAWSERGYFAIGGVSLLRQDVLACGPDDHIVLLGGASGETLREYSDVIDCLATLIREMAGAWSDEGQFVGNWNHLDAMIAGAAGSA